MPDHPDDDTVRDPSTPQGPLDGRGDVGESDGAGDRPWDAGVETCAQTGLDTEGLETSSPSGSHGATATAVSDEADEGARVRAWSADPRTWWVAARERWSPAELISGITAIVVVSACSLLLLRTMQPGELVRTTTPTGGDMGAHVWGPAFLRDHLLPSGRLSGWTMDWYAGFPIYRFYMVVPALAIVLVDLILPYEIAFKFVSVAGIITMPIACYAMGRLARLAFPIPVMFALAGTVFLYDESFTIYGGNIASTMAGEFSFSLALTLSMVAFGLVARGLQDGTHRISAAILIALAALCHGIVLMFVFGGVVVMGLVSIDRARWRYLWTTVLTAIALSAFWVLPFLANHAYMTDMKYGGEPGGGSFRSLWGMYFPLPTFFDITFTTLAVIGLAASVVRRRLFGVWLGVMAILLAAAVHLAQDSLPVIGLLWNPRILPFFHLVRYLLAAIGIVEVVRALARLAQLERVVASPRADRGLASADDDLIETSVGTDVVGTREGVAVNAEATAAVLDPTRRLGWWATGAAIVGVSALSILVVLGFRYQQLPFGNLVTNSAGQAEYRWGPVRSTAPRGFVDGWARWNYSGYEAKPDYPEYQALVEFMDTVGSDPAHGCGRALWENTAENNRYGTTMALMLLPYWTDGCIASMEGLFFEAAGSTPYHFLAAAAMSKSSSNPVRELRYVDNDAEVGVRHMRDMGVRYFLAYTPEAKAEADARSELTVLGDVGPWRVYELGTAAIVEPLSVEPVVVDARSGDQRERWLELGSSWYQRPEDWAAIPAADGPETWQRIQVRVDEDRRIGVEGAPGRRVDVVVPTTAIESRPLPPVTVSDVDMGTDSVRFRVDQIGVPVLVRVSFFPGWNVSGAEGPYRIAPNMMVVIPTDTEVEMSYGGRGIDLAAAGLSLVGIAVLVVFRRRGPVPMAPLGSR